VRDSSGKPGARNERGLVANSPTPLPEAGKGGTAIRYKEIEARRCACGDEIIGKEDCLILPEGGQGE
jgi:hypothetical protein